MARFLLEMHETHFALALVGPTDGTSVMNTDTKMLSRAAQTASALLLMVGTSSVFAAATWTFGYSPCQPTFTACAASETNEGSATAKIVGASAYATTDKTGTTPKFAAAAFTDWDGSGLGVKASGESTTSPQHSMDNSGATELMVFQFDKSIILDKVVLGWTYNDADLSIFRWAGGTAPTLSSALVGKTASDLGSTWSLVGNYSVTPGTTSSTDVIVDVNSGAASSSWWIISAYNSAYGAISSPDTMKDYMKVLAFVSQSPVTPPSNGVPEPGSFALVGAAFAGWFMTRRRSRASAT